MGTHVQFSSPKRSACSSVSSSFVLTACSLPKGQVRRSSYFGTVFQHLRLGSLNSRLLCHAVEFVVRHFVLQA